uniref:Uncharacterized protein n=1 Tax=viral metagenome TaxID=1070528 RepID=A0A6C0AEN5_9ZZZZ
MADIQLFKEINNLDVDKFSKFITNIKNNKNAIYENNGQSLEYIGDNTMRYNSVTNWNNNGVTIYKQKFLQVSFDDEEFKNIVKSLKKLLKDTKSRSPGRSAITNGNSRTSSPSRNTRTASSMNGNLRTSSPSKKSKTPPSTNGNSRTASPSSSLNGNSKTPPSAKSNSRTASKSLNGNSNTPPSMNGTSRTSSPNRSLNGSSKTPSSINENTRTASPSRSLNGSSKTAPSMNGNTRTASPSRSLNGNSRTASSKDNILTKDYSSSRSQNNLRSQDTYSPSRRGSSSNYFTNSDSTYRGDNMPNNDFSSRNSSDVYPSSRNSYLNIDNDSMRNY